MAADQTKVEPCFRAQQLLQRKHTSAGENLTSLRLVIEAKITELENSKSKIESTIVFLRSQLTQL